MSELTARVIGADGRMGKEHVAAFQECGVDIVEGDADIVSIASPDNTHAEYVLKALKRGSHVFCEKPIATNPKDLGKIVNMAETEGLAVWQHFPLRYQPIFNQIAQAVDDNYFGEIYRIEASYNWGRTDKLFYGWRAGDPDYSLILGGMIHMIDLVAWMRGSLDIEHGTVFGTGLSTPGFDNYDTAVASAITTDGVICVFTVDGGRGVKGHNHRLLIHGSKGGRTVVNHEPTDKRAMIRDFVDHLQRGDYQLKGLAASIWANYFEDQLQSKEILV